MMNPIHMIYSGIFKNSVKLSTKAVIKCSRHSGISEA